MPAVITQFGERITWFTGETAFVGCNWSCGRLSK